VRADWTLERVPIGKLRKNPFNPRKTFDVTDGRRLGLDDLARQIRKDGVLLPLIVRQWNGGYQVAAGERRRMAAEMAGLPTVPAIVREMDDAKMRRYALVENLHRMDLTDEELEEAIARIWEEDYEASDDRGVIARMSEDLGIRANDVGSVIRAHKGRRAEPAFVDREIKSKEVAQLSTLAEESPKEARRLAQALAKGELEHGELKDAISLVRGAPKERRADVVRSITTTAETRVRARREVAETIEQSERQLKESPDRKEFQRLLVADQRLLNRVADLVSMSKKLDFTFLELIQTPDARSQAVEMLEEAREQIDRAIAQARKAEARWRKEFDRRFPDLAD
jgi:ParB/RepB/Spo0J family partition protein